MSVTQEAGVSEYAGLDWSDADLEIVVGKPEGEVSRPLSQQLSGAAIAVWGWIWRSRWTRIIGPLAVLGIWELLSATGTVSELQLPAPGHVWQTGVQLFNSGTLMPAIGVSCRRVALGLLLGLSLGTGLALLAGLSLVGERLIDPVMHMFRTLPVLALLPLFVVWFGIGEKAKVYVIAFAVIFPIYINTYAGIRSVDEKLVTAGRVLGLGRWGLIRHVILPGALPQFLTGLRLALGVSWLVLVAAEEINATSGLGALIINAQSLSQTDTIYVGLIVFALLGLLTDVLVRLIERWTLSWRSSFLTK
jgi:sulfonate transport system permease protein